MVRRSQNRILIFPGRGASSPHPAAELLTFEEALAAQLNSLYSTACRLVRDPAQAEDLVQEVALKAYRSFKDLRSHDRFRAWLFTILHNTARNFIRDASRRVPYVDVELDALIEDPLLADEHTHTPEQELLSDCLPELMEAGLNALPRPQLTVLWLVEVEEFTLAEAAEILSVPVGTAASRLYRARRALRDYLQRERRPQERGGEA